MKSITELTKLVGKKVIIRVDYNVPLKGNRILDSRRITSSYKTINTVIKKGGTPLIITHLGNGNETLKPIARFLAKTYKVLFLSDTIDTKTLSEVIANAQKGTIILLENLRRDPGEEKNSLSFAKKIAALGDVYINDAFSVSHRSHASIVSVPKLLPSYAGFQLQEEISALGAVLTEQRHPFLFILGGAKFGTKIPLLDRFSVLADTIVITGAIANNFYAAAGFEVGKSVIERGYEPAIKKLLRNPAVLVPTDVVVKRGTKNITVAAHEVQPGDTIYDLGKESIAQIGKKIAKAKLVVWNGPTGWYEGGYTHGTVALAKALIHSKTKAIIGGGDTAAVIEKMFSTKKQKRIFISTGGGATLDYLTKGTLPGITALA